MKKRLIQLLLALIAAVVVLYPASVWYQEANIVFDGTLFYTFFPLFGLIAFTIMWLHVVGAALRPWLEQYINFGLFVEITSDIVLACIILHPLFLLMGLGVALWGTIFLYGPVVIWSAIIGWFLLITYDVGKFFHKRQFFIKHWETIEILSTIGFFLVFIHSIGIGDQLQSGLLRIVWYFYGASAAFCTIYVFVSKRMQKS